MVKLGIISDNHESEFWIQKFVEHANAQGYDAVFHLGDGQSGARWMARRLNMPFIRVAGNCDTDRSIPREAYAEYEGYRILAVHGDLYDVKWGLDKLSYYAEEHGARIVLFGHTHRAETGYVGKVLAINPGALMQGYYAELLLDGDRAVPYLKSL